MVEIPLYALGQGIDDETGWATPEESDNTVENDGRVLVLIAVPPGEDDITATVLAQRDCSHHHGFEAGALVNRVETCKSGEIHFMRLMEPEQFNAAEGRAHITLSAVPEGTAIVAVRFPRTR